LFEEEDPVSQIQIYVDMVFIQVLEEAPSV
jgi:hypothetical protein